MSFFSAVEFVSGKGLRFSPEVVVVDQQRSRREIVASLIGALLGVLLWATFSTFAPMVQKPPYGLAGAVFWPLALLYLGGVGAMIIAIVNRVGGPRAAVSIALLLPTLLPFFVSLVGADLSAIQAIPTTTWAHSPFVARPLANSFDVWRRTPYEYKPALDLTFGLIGCSLWSAFFLVPITLFVRFVGLAAAPLSTVLVRVTIALSAIMIVVGGARAFSRPSLSDLPFVGAVIGTAQGSPSMSDCPACTDEIVPCCTSINTRTEDSRRPSLESRYSEPLGPFTLRRHCTSNQNCGLELFDASTGTHSYAGAGAAIRPDTPVTLRYAPEQGMYWLLVNDVPIGSAPEPAMAKSCETAVAGLARPAPCRVDARASARSLLGVVGPPRPVVLVAALGLALAIAMHLAGASKHGSALLVRDTATGPRVDFDASATEPSMQVRAELSEKLASDPKRWASVLGGRAWVAPIGAMLVIVMTSFTLFAALIEGFFL